MDKMKHLAACQTSSEMRERLFALLDALSAIRLLADSDLQYHTEEQLVSYAVDVLMKHADLEQCSVFIAEGSILRCIRTLSANDDDLFTPMEAADKERLPAIPDFVSGEGIIGRVFESGRLEYCRNCLNDERYDPFRDIILGFDAGSMLVVPIASGRETMGVLYVAHLLPEYFEPWHQQMLTLFCTLLGQMLRGHRLLNDLETEVRNRTVELEKALEDSRKLARRYKELASVDELTGLRNRRYFFEEGAAVLARAQRNPENFSLLLIDIDNFKHINDTLGHQQGDAVLSQLAQLLKAEGRIGDIVARVGGEEFCILLPATDREGADQVAQRIQEAVAALKIDFDSPDPGLTVSIGMATWSEIPPGDPVRILDGFYLQADIAMYACKRAGHNRRMFYSEELSRQSA